MGAVLVLDTALLTLLLAASGGVSNPFTILYLVQITLSAVVLNERWTSLIAALSVTGFGSLFLLPASADHAHHATRVGSSAGIDRHLQGMWLAFVVAAVLTTIFVRRIARAIARQNEQLSSMREANARNARLASLTTLAAGAAHELGSPLGTIAIAAHEARLAAAKLPAAAVIAEDLQLISLEVERCQTILGQMGARAAQSPTDSVAKPLHDIVETVARQLNEADRQRVEWQLPAPPVAVEMPAAPLIQSMLALLRNGLEASPNTSTVRAELRSDADGLAVIIGDQGTGIAAEHLGHVGEPFFTTKQPGRGLGLGIFLARAFAESRGGTLTLEANAPVGTRAIMRLPANAAQTLGTVEGSHGR